MFLVVYCIMKNDFFLKNHLISVYFILFYFKVTSFYEKVEYITQKKKNFTYHFFNLKIYDGL